MIRLTFTSSPAARLFIAVSTFLGTVGPLAAEDSPPPKLTAQQSAELLKLLNDFRLPTRSAEDRDRIVDRIFELGPIGVRSFSAQIEKTVRPQIERYRDKFFKQALALEAGKTKGADHAKEIAELRSVVLALKEKMDLTKDEIVKTGDPAMKRLSELLVIDRQAVFTAAPTLEKERTALASAAKYWERCGAFQNSQLPEEQRSKEPLSFENYLQGEEELAARLAMPMDQNARNVLAANDRLAPQLDPEEAKGILACNLTRLLLGLNPCAIDLQLVAAAKDHSHDMETLKFFAHESPVEGKKLPWDRAKRMGTTADAENIFAGLTSGQAANAGWFHSPGHHKNMLGDHARIGLGLSGRYFTEMFGK